MVFSAFGEAPTPAPCDLHPFGRPGDPLCYLPSAEALSASTSALYEYLGTPCGTDYRAGPEGRRHPSLALSAFPLFIGAKTFYK